MSSEEVQRDIFLEYLKKHYKKQYYTTYSPTDENIERALEVYEFCMLKGLFRSVDECVDADLKFRKRNGLKTYGYRRMENFLKELGLYRVGGYWFTAEYTVKASTFYVGNGDIEINVDYILYAPPLDLTFREDEENRENDDAYEVVKDTIQLIMTEHYNLRFLLGHIDDVRYWRVEFSINEEKIGEIIPKYFRYDEIKQRVYYSGEIIIDKPRYKYQYDLSGFIVKPLFRPFSIISKIIMKHPDTELGKNPVLPLVPETVADAILRGEFKGEVE